MVVLVTCKNEEYPIKIEDAREVTKMLHYPSNLRCSRTANSLIGNEILTKFKLTQALIVVLLICKNEYDLFQFESTRVVKHFSHYKSMGIF